MNLSSTILILSIISYTSLALIQEESLETGRFSILNPQEINGAFFEYTLPDAQTETINSLMEIGKLPSGIYKLGEITYATKVEYAHITDYYVESLVSKEGSNQLYKIAFHLWARADEILEIVDFTVVEEV